MVFKWIKSVLSGTKKTRPEDIGQVLKEEISVKDIGEWFASKEAQVMKSLNDELRGFVAEIDEIKPVLRRQLTALGNAKLQNENISVRELQIMLGNRTAFITRIQRFNEKLKVPEIVDHETALAFSEKTLSEIKEMLASVEKSYHVLQFFYANEAQKIIGTLKKINSLCEKIKEMIDSDERLQTAVFVKSLIPEISKDLDIKLKLSSDLKNTTISISELNQSKQQAEADLKKLEQSQKFLELSELKSRLSELEKQSVDAREKIYDHFYLLNKPLNKFKVGNENELMIAKYVEDPIKGLESDTDLKICAVLERLKLQIISGSFEVKDRIKPKLLDAINNLDRNKLIDLFSAHRRCVNELENTHKKYDGHPSKIEQNRQVCKIGYIDEQIKSLRVKAQQITEKFDEIKVQEKITKAEKAIEELTGITVTVKL